MLKRMLAMFLVLTMVVTMLPVQTIALETEEPMETILETEPAAEETEPAEEVTEPVEEVTEPAEEVTEPAEEVTEPAEEVMEPTEEETEPEEEEPELISLEAPELDAEELLMGYLSPFYNGGGASSFGTMARDRLSGPNRHLYDGLVERIVQIANGEEEYTRVDVSFQGSGYSGEDVDIGLVQEALMLDFAYEMYWYIQCWYALSPDSVAYIMEPSAFYLPPDTEFDPYNPYIDISKTRNASAAATNIGDIIDCYETASDYDKLCGYADEICALVEYDYDAADNGNSLYPVDNRSWTLVNVFDGNINTNVVCEGYAEAYQFLCEETIFQGDVVCFSATGNNHKWNIVRIDGVSYLMDVTHCDDEYDDSEYAYRGPKFLGGGSGSVSDGYYIGGFDYWYDPSSLEIYGDGEDSILKLSPTKYTPPASCSHSFGDYVVTKDATCEEPGTEERTCTLCGVTESREIPAGHTVVDGICTVCQVNGTCGEDVTWEFKQDSYTLMIRGTGKMDTGEGAVVPWSAYKKDIRRVIIIDGVDGIDNFGLSRCDIILFGGNAPSTFAADSFKNLYSSFGRTVISYSADTSGWNSIVGEQFGGNVIWAEQNGAVSRLRNLCVATAWLFADELRTLVQDIDRNEILEGMRNGLFTFDESDDSEISVLEEAIGSSLEIQFSNVPKLAALGATHWWYAEGMALNDPVDPDAGHVLLLSEAKDPVPVLDGYDTEGSIPFAVSISNLQNEAYLAVPVNVAINYGNTESLTSNPFFYSMFWRNNQTGDIEEIPLRIRWHKAGYYMEFVMEGTGEYLLAMKASAKTGTCGDSLTWTYTLDSTLTISGNGAMYDYDLEDNQAPWYYFREQVNNIIIEDGVTGIGNYAFNDCRFVNQLDIPASVERIGEGALYGMYNLDILYFDGNAPVIEENAFYNMRCSAYYDPAKEGWDEATKSIYGAESDENYGFRWIPLTYSGKCGEDLTWTFDQTTGTLTISGTGTMPHFDTDAENMVPWAGISAKVKKIVLEEGVQNISFMAFYMCTNVESVEIADSVTTISEASLPALENLYIPKGVTQMYFVEGGINCGNIHVSEDNTVYASIDGVLFNKDKTKLLRYPSMRTGAYAVPEGVTTIAEWAFANNKDLTAIHLPDSLETIERIALSYTGLAELVIPDNVKTIANSAFAGCYGLERLTIGKQVESIASSAFESCRNLKEITFAGDAPVIDSDSFRDVTATAYYPVDNGTWTDDILLNYSGNITWIPVMSVQNRVGVKQDDLNGQTSVWIDGREYPVNTDSGMPYVDLPDSNAKTMVAYTYGESNGKPYPNGMKVWTLSNADGFYTATRAEELDDMLGYEGCSIRVTGKQGIRMITSIEETDKDALTGAGLVGYTLVEYGTAIAWADQISSNKPLVLGKSYVSSNFAYSKAEGKDPIFAYEDDRIHYTNVLVGFTLDQCKDDIAMRPYMILADAEGNEITLYGGIVERSIGYIALQNQDTFAAGSEADAFVESIIDHVYGG